MLVSLNRFWDSTWFRHWLYATCLFWIAGQTWHVRYQPIPWWTDGYTLSGKALLISFAVGLVWVAVVFVWKRFFKSSASNEQPEGKTLKWMKWTRVACGIYLALLAVGSVGMVVMFLLGPGSPTGEAAGLTYLYAFFAMLCMLPVILLVAAVEGLWVWIKYRKIDPEPGDVH